MHRDEIIEALCLWRSDMPNRDSKNGRILTEAIAALSSPCACRGEEPIAVLHGYAVAGGNTERKTVHLVVQERLVVHNFEDMPVCLEGEQARVIILKDKPCS